MKLKSVLLGTALLVGLAAGSANATSITPGLEPVPVSPAFGGLVAGGAAGTNYIDHGIDFSYGNVEGIFNDGGGVLAFGGVNGAGNVDLVTAVDGAIVAAGTTNLSSTSSFFAEAGFAADGSLTLSLFDSSMNLIAALLNGPPPGGNGRTTFSYVSAISNIVYFSISGNDTFGVNEIRIDDTTPIPLPAALPLLLAGLAGLGVAGFRRKSA